LSGYRGTGGPQNDAHAVEITFFGEIDVEKSKYVWCCSGRKRVNTGLAC